MNSPVKNSTPVAAGLDFRKLFFHYLSYWKWFVLSVVCFVAAGIVYLFLATPQYEVSASILIKDSHSSNPNNTSIVEQFDFFSSRKIFENEMEILRSFSLIKQVVKDLNLQVAYSIKDGLKNIPIYTEVPVRVEILKDNQELYEAPIEISFSKPEHISINGKSFPYSNTLIAASGSMKITVNDSLLTSWNKQEPIYISIAPVDFVAESLRSAINTTASRKESSILNISMLTPLPERGVEIINRLLKVYNSAEVADKNQLIGSTLSFIDERLAGQENELRTAETTVQNFKSSRGITDISEESKLFLASVQKNDMDRSQAEIQLSVLKDIELYILNETENDGGTTPATLGVNDPTLLSLITALSSTQAERRKMLRTLKPANPIILAYDDQIQALKQNISDNITSYRNGLEITLQKLDEENKRLERMIQSIPRRERELVDITRERDIKNDLYMFLLSKREEAAISYASAIANSRLIDPAHSSLYPVKPKRNMVLVATFLLGLLFPASILWIKGLFHDKITSKEELEKLLRAPIVGEVSQSTQSEQIISINEKRGKSFEQLRMLRTNLERMCSEKPLRAILITSNISGEGKSFLSANLGTTFAATGKRTIIIDFDMYKKSLQKMVGAENSKGLYNYLFEQAPLDELIQKAMPQIDNLDILTSGKIPTDHGELLLKEPLRKLMDELLTRYDYVIMDTPPLGIISDSLILSNLSDASLIVVRQDYTPKTCLYHINELYNNKQMPNMCVVVNGIDDKKWHGYTSYNSDKYYKQYCGNGKKNS